MCKFWFAVVELQREADCVVQIADSAVALKHIPALRTTSHFFPQPNSRIVAHQLPSVCSMLADSWRVCCAFRWEPEQRNG